MQSTKCDICGVRSVSFDFPGPEIVEIDVIIVNYHCAEDTLAAVSSGQPWSGCRLWVVDNSCDPIESQRLESALAKEPVATLLVAQHNLGFGAGCNLAYKQGSGRFVLLLNPDARLDASALAQLRNALEREARFAAVAPAIRWDHAGGFLLPTLLPETPVNWLMMALSYRWPGLGRLWSTWQIARQRRLHAARSLRQVDFLSGAVLVLRRDALDAVGGLFDEKYFMFYEDADLSRRLRSARWKLGLLPDVYAEHHWRHGQHKASLMADSAAKYVDQYYPWLVRWMGRDGNKGVFSSLARVVGLEGYGRPFSRGVASFSQLSSELSGESVSAISPLLPGYPALFRQDINCSARISESEWFGLDPGLYVLYTIDLKTGRKNRRILEKV